MSSGGGEAFVLDASVTLSWLLEGERTPPADSLLSRLSEGRVEVPSLWCYEVANGLVVNERRGKLTAAQGERCLAALAWLPITVHPAPSSPAPFHSLGRRAGLTAYDAAYLELALRLGLPLATFDAALRTAATGAGVPLVG